MRQAIAKYLLLLAILLMPFGMTPASASAADSSAATMRHCEDQRAAHHGKNGIAQCTMACAAALPASLARSVDLPEIAPSLHAHISIALLNSVQPDTATPPPR